jgi:acyl carrier protein
MEPSARLQILGYLQHVMKDMFKLDPARVIPEARLSEDLELDSLDAIDISIKVEEITGQALAEDQLRTLRTVDDVINAIATVGPAGLDKLVAQLPGPLPSES